MSPQAARYTVLKSGATGSQVRALQEALTELGFYTGTVDSKYGAGTKAAVTAFEDKNKLTTDGVADQELQLLLFEGKPRNSKGTRKAVKTVPMVSGVTINGNDTGEAVEKLQRRLSELGYYAGEINGVCDKATVKALKAFQTKMSILADGIATPDALTILYGATAIAAAQIVTPTPSPTVAPPTDTPSKTIQAPSGMEFLIQIQQGSAKLLVIPSYNFSKMKFASSNLANGVFETMDPVINKARVTKRGRVIQEVREEASLLREGPFEGTNHHWFQDGKHIHLRIPWQRLLVTDPSSHMVLNDLSHWNSYPLRDTFKTVKTEGFVVSAVLMNSSGSLLDIFPGDHVFDNPAPFLWKGWDKPKYRERLKESYTILKEFFRDFGK